LGRGRLSIAQATLEFRKQVQAMKQEQTQLDEPTRQRLKLNQDRVGRLEREINSLNSAIAQGKVNPSNGQARVEALISNLNGLIEEHEKILNNTPPPQQGRTAPAPGRRGQAPALPAANLDRDGYVTALKNAGAKPDEIKRLLKQKFGN
jgi:hypothetical protein